LSDTVFGLVRATELLLGVDCWRIAWAYADGTAVRAVTTTAVASHVLFKDTPSLDD
jgi:hypothetical protein